MFTTAVQACLRNVGVGLALLGAGSAQAALCEIASQSLVFPLADFVSTAPNMLERDTTLSLLTSGDCSGTLSISFSSDVGRNPDAKSPSFFVASNSRLLFNSYAGKTDTLSVSLAPGLQKIQFPLRIVVDASKARDQQGLGRQFQLVLEHHSLRTAAVSLRKKSLTIDASQPAESFKKMRRMETQAVMLDASAAVHSSTPTL